MFRRQSGVLLHISSLPSAYGIGDFGPQAYEFVEFLSRSKQSLWQILPLNPTNPFWGSSPYSSHSAFAGNPLFISPELLWNEGLLTQEDIMSNQAAGAESVDYERASEMKNELLGKAYQNFCKRTDLHAEFSAFEENHKKWLEDYSAFCLIKDHFGGQCWAEWPENFRSGDKTSINKLVKKNRDAFQKLKFIQFIFFRQWEKLKQYANSRNIDIIGDLPIYVSYDSADVWKEPQWFKMDGAGNLDVVAGVPPDYFSKTGQRWGNPVYNWDNLKTSGFEWWLRRIRQNLTLFDFIRIDHFRAFVNYWEIPSTEETAINGYWVDAPTRDFFGALKDEFGEMPFIAEDLGLIDDQTREKIEALGFPGMKILLFAFNGDMKTHIYLPHNFTPNCVVYTGTHDNNTAVGWYEREATEQEKANLAEYYKEFTNMPAPDRSVSWDLIELALFSKARMAVFPLQDILGLGESARMNVPGTVTGNWLWKLDQAQMTAGVSERLARYTSEANRAI